MARGKPSYAELRSFTTRCAQPRVNRPSPLAPMGIRIFTEDASDNEIPFAVEFEEFDVNRVALADEIVTTQGL